MPFVENPLSDAELDAACRGPRFDKQAVFGAAEAAFATWRKRNWPVIERVAPLPYVVINAADNTRAFGENLDKAYDTYCERHGPTPKSGRHILGFRLPAPC